MGGSAAVMLLLSLLVQHNTTTHLPEPASSNQDPFSRSPGQSRGRAHPHRM